MVGWAVGLWLWVSMVGSRELRREGFGDDDARWGLFVGFDDRCVGLGLGHGDVRRGLDCRDVWNDRVTEVQEVLQAA